MTLGPRHTGSPGINDDALLKISILSSSGPKSAYPPGICFRQNIPEWSTSFCCWLCPLWLCNRNVPVREVWIWNQPEMAHCPSCCSFIGSCMDYKSCSGTHKRNMCPGAWNIQCCFSSGSSTSRLVWNSGHSAPCFPISRCTDGSSGCYSHSEAKSKLAAGGITQLVSSGQCSTKSNKKCTSLQQIHPQVISGIVDFKAKSGCNVVITGGTEVGHSAGDLLFLAIWLVLGLVLSSVRFLLQAPTAMQMAGNWIFACSAAWPTTSRKTSERRSRAVCGATGTTSGSLRATTGTSTSADADREKWPSDYLFILFIYFARLIFVEVNFLLKQWWERASVLL